MHREWRWQYRYEILFKNLSCPSKSIPRPWHPTRSRPPLPEMLLGSRYGRRTMIDRWSYTSLTGHSKPPPIRNRGTSTESRPCGIFDPADRTVEGNLRSKKSGAEPCTSWARGRRVLRSCNWGPGEATPYEAEWWGMPYVSPRARRVQTIQHQDIALRLGYRDSRLWSSSSRVPRQDSSRVPRPSEHRALAAQDRHEAHFRYLGPCPWPMRRR